MELSRIATGGPSWRDATAGVLGRLRALWRLPDAQTRIAESQALGHRIVWTVMPDGRRVFFRCEACSLPISECTRQCQEGS